MNLALFVLDTDILTLFREGHPNVCHRANLCLAPNLATTIVTFEEQLTGWYSQVRKSKNDQKLVWAYEELAHTGVFFDHAGPVLNHRRRRASIGFESTADSNWYE